MKFRSGMHLRAQVLQRSPLKLLDRSFGFAEVLGDLANTSLFHKTHHDHATLIFRQPILHVSTLSTYRRWERLRGQVCTFTLFLQAVENESHLSVGLL